MKAGCCLLALLSCLCLAPPERLALAQPALPAISTLEGLVVGVSEGDRLTVNSFGTEIKVKLYGVAAPQTAKMDKFTGWYKAGQPYADDAFRALSIKVLHQQVKVEIRNTLVYKSAGAKQIAVATVYLGGRNINLEMLSEGWGWADKKLISKEDFSHFLAAEKQARSCRCGLWTQERPQPPWDFKPPVRFRAKHG